MCKGKEGFYSLMPYICVHWWPKFLCSGQAHCTLPIQWLGCYRQLLVWSAPGHGHCDRQSQWSPDLAVLHIPFKVTLGLGGNRLWMSNASLLENPSNSAKQSKEKPILNWSDYDDLKCDWLLRGSVIYTILLDIWYCKLSMASILCMKTWLVILVIV